jgi:predicted DNA-binding transcriptional regulator AlpA
MNCNRQGPPRPGKGAQLGATKMADQQHRASFVVRKKDLPRFVGLNRTQIEQLIDRGEFPRGMKVSDSGRARIWTEEEIAEWQQSRFAKRDAAK